jgi:4'-phosphopantetheinyl transferase EntD
MSRSPLDGLFGAGVIAEELSPLPDDVALHPEEARAIAAAAPKRQREFAAGRLCARRALGRLGVSGFPLLAGPDRAPHWPPGVVGSISHTDRYAIAVVAPRASYRSVGVDAEPDEPLEEDLWAAICTGRELRWLEAQPSPERGRLARLIFSAKESFYKLQFPLTGAMLEFGDVRIDIEPERDLFAATLLRAAGRAFPAGYALAGRFRIDADGIRTGMALGDGSATVRRHDHLGLAPDSEQRSMRCAKPPAESSWS